MGKTIDLTSGDGYAFGAYTAGGEDKKAALVVIQEIFGVNHHIRTVTDGFAEQGFYAVAPALFDRVERGVELDYRPDGIEKGRAIMGRLSEEEMLKDIAAGIVHARSQTASGKVGVVGYCLGGTLAWQSATRLGPDAAVGYYGGGIVKRLEERPACPVMLHFGGEDAHIPPADVEKIREAYPQMPVYMYNGAGHGFNCNERASYNPEAAALAYSRTLDFLREHLHG
jgi:carboxymethylenebutenolidase